MDIATIIGLLMGFGVLLGAVLTAEGADLRFFIDYPSMLCTFGGTIAAMIITYPIPDLKQVGRVVKLAFVKRSLTPNQVIDDFRKFADIARRDGILALENVTSEVKEPFLVRGIQLAVDGTDPEVIQTMMQTELDQMGQRHDRGIKILKSVAGLAPAFGMIGTLMGLVIMLRNSSDPAALMGGMGVAVITSFYGAMTAYLLAAPLADRLSIRSKDEVLLREMIIKGVMSIQSGDNPRIVEQKLRIFLAPRLRGTST